MKIDNYVPSAVASGIRADEVASTSSGSGSVKDKLLNGSSDDHFELSGTSRTLQLASQSRANRLQQLSQLVRSGQYSVSSQLISQALVGETIGNGKTPW